MVPPSISKVPCPLAQCAPGARHPYHLPSSPPPPSLPRFPTLRRGTGTSRGTPIRRRVAEGRHGLLHRWTRPAGCGGCRPRHADPGPTRERGSGRAFTRLTQTPRHVPRSALGRQTARLGRPGSRPRSSGTGLPGNVAIRRGAGGGRPRRAWEIMQSSAPSRRSRPRPAARPRVFAADGEHDVADVAVRGPKKVSGTFFTVHLLSQWQLIVVAASAPLAIMGLTCTRPCGLMRRRQRGRLASAYGPSAGGVMRVATMQVVRGNDLRSIVTIRGDVFSFFQPTRHHLTTSPVVRRAAGPSRSRTAAHEGFHGLESDRRRAKEPQTPLLAAGAALESSRSCRGRPSARTPLRVCRRSQSLRLTHPRQTWTAGELHE